MKQSSGPVRKPAETVIKDIRRATRRQFSADAQEPHPARTRLPARRAGGAGRRLRRALQPCPGSREPGPPQPVQRLLRTWRGHPARTSADQAPDSHPPPLAPSHAGRDRTSNGVTKTSRSAGPVARVEFADDCPPAHHRRMQGRPRFCPDGPGSRFVVGPLPRAARAERPRPAAHVLSAGSHPDLRACLAGVPPRFPSTPAPSEPTPAESRAGDLRRVIERCPACGAPYSGFVSADTRVFQVDRAQWRTACPKAMFLDAPGACQELQAAWRPTTRPEGLGRSPKSGRS